MDNRQKTMISNKLAITMFFSWIVESTKFYTKSWHLLKKVTSDLPSYIFFIFPNLSRRVDRYGKLKTSI